MTHLFFCTSLALAGWEQKRPRHRAPPLSTGTVTSVHSPSHVHSPHQYLKRRERKRICTQSHTFEHLQFLLLCQLLHNQWSGMDSIPARAAGFFKLRCVETWIFWFWKRTFQSPKQPRILICTAEAALHTASRSSHEKHRGRSAFTLLFSGASFW